MLHYLYNLLFYLIIFIFQLLNIKQKNIIYNFYYLHMLSSFKYKLKLFDPDPNPVCFLLFPYTLIIGFWLDLV